MGLNELFGPDTVDVDELARQGCYPGQMVLDQNDLEADQKSYQPLYVLVVSDVTAREKEIAETGKTVAGHNPDYPNSDRVVRAAYGTALDDAYGSAWRKHVFHDLPAYVERVRNRTGTYPNTYDYPESRLVPATLELRIVPGGNPGEADLERLERRLRRFTGSLDLEGDPDGE